MFCIFITEHAFFLTAMAVFDHLGLVSLAVLMLASHLLLFGCLAYTPGTSPAGNDPDPYLKVWCGTTFGGMTEFHRDSANPSWSAEFNFPYCEPKDALKFQVWDKDLNFDDHLGTLLLHYSCPPSVCHIQYVL
uniref:C2 domain-containing protein n=1 Tax=Sinocyclocheilus rhinocerous TaxID=307959 RepID=A0A673NIJ5_9TELE